MKFQSGINQLLGLGAAISTAKKATEAASQKAEYNESMQQVKLQTAQEKLKNVKLQNKNLRFKNRALKNMQQNGQSKAEGKTTFKEFYAGLSDNPPDLGGDKTLYNRLGSSAQEQIAKQLYEQHKKEKK